MLIPYHRYLCTGNSDHDSDCDLNEQTTSSVSSPTQKNTSTTSGGQTSTLSATSGSTTRSTEATEQHTISISTTSSGEPSVNTETRKQPTMDILTTSRPIPQHSRVIIAITENKPNETMFMTSKGQCITLEDCENLLGSFLV